MSATTPSGGVAGRREPHGWRALPGVRGLVRRGPEEGAGGTDWLGRLVGLVALVGVGVTLGIQYLTPSTRVIAVVVAVAICGLFWRLNLVSGLGLLILVLPYPRGTVFGSTNVALVLVMVLIWLLRASLRQAPLPQRTPVDGPMLALLGCFIVSFYNIEKAASIGPAIDTVLHLLAGMAVLWLIVNNVRRPEHLERLHLFQCASIALVGLFGIYEIRHPNGVLIPGWISFHHGVSDAINIHNVRIGGPFFDFELLSEYCALNLPLVALMLVRARSGTRRVVFAGLLVLTVFIMFMTVTRGGIVSLIVGLAYLAWLQRRRLRLVPAVLMLAAAIVGLQAVNYIVATFTHSGNLFERMLDPTSMQFENGLPTARVALWRSAFERMMLHPIIGHGPVYTLEKGLDFWYWPHNGYLYVGNLVGLVGLTCFLWLLWRLWRLSRPPGTDLNDPNYARAFLIIGHVQLLVFMVDQMKIDFMRISVFAYQIWLMFASIVAAHQISRDSQPAPAPTRTRR